MSNPAPRGVAPTDDDHEITIYHDEEGREVIVATAPCPECGAVVCDLPCATRQIGWDAEESRM